MANISDTWSSSWFQNKIIGCFFRALTMSYSNLNPFPGEEDGILMWKKKNKVEASDGPGRATEFRVEPDHLHAAKV